MVISVLVEISFNNKEKTFDYLVPKDLEDKIEIGKRVLVPFGKQNLEGFIIDIKKNSEYDLKEITSIIDEEPILNEELLNLGKELKKDLDNKYLAENCKDFKCGLSFNSLCSSKIILVIPITPYNGVLNS